MSRDTHARRSLALAAATALVTVVLTACSGTPSPQTLSPNGLWVADCGSDTVAWYPDPGRSAGGPNRTIGDGLACPSAVAFDGGGNLWVANRTGGSVVAYDGGSLLGNPKVAATVSQGLTAPDAIAFDAGGNLWVADGSADLVVRFPAADLRNDPAANQSITTSGSAPVALAFDASGNLWAAYNGGLAGIIVEYSAGSLDTTPASLTTIALGGYVRALAFDAAGDLWYAPSTGKLTRFSALSLDTPPTAVDASFAPALPAGALALDSHGDLYASSSAEVDAYRAKDIAAVNGSPAPTATLAGLTRATALAFDPPPAALPLAP